MGHERIGFLPRSKQWKLIIGQLTAYDNSSSSLAQIAYGTLKNIKNAYESMISDESVIKAIKYLSILSASAKKENQIQFLNENGIIVDDNISLYSLAKSVKNYIKTENDSLEINKIVCDSVLQALTSYERNNENYQLSFFRDSPLTPWSNIGSGSAFSEIARSFFANFTNHNLKYFLEREAASSINDYQQLSAFTRNIEEHSKKISHHAFDTSKIMQSFAAGWFNKYSNNSMPTNNEIADFLRITFGKLREEFRREADEL